MPYQKPKKKNPALERALIEKRIQQGMNSAKLAGMEFATIAYNIISVMVLYDKLGLTDQQIESYMKHVSDLSESVSKDYVDIPDMIKAIKEEHGININDEILLKYYPSLEGYLSPEES